MLVVPRSRPEEETAGWAHRWIADAPIRLMAAAPDVATTAS